MNSIVFILFIFHIFRTILALLFFVVTFVCKLKKQNLAFVDETRHQIFTAIVEYGLTFKKLLDQICKLLFSDFYWLQIIAENTEFSCTIK